MSVEFGDEGFSSRRPTLFGEVVERLEEEGFKTAAERTRQFEETLYESGDLFKESDVDPFEQDELFNADLEIALMPIRKEFGAYFTGGSESPEPSQDSVLSPRFAHTFREKLGGDAPDDSTLSDLTTSPVFRNEFEPEERRLLNRIVVALDKKEISQVGSVRSADPADLLEIKGVRHRAVVFLETALRKHPK